MDRLIYATFINSAIVLPSGPGEDGTKSMESILKEPESRVGDGVRPSTEEAGTNNTHGCEDNGKVREKK